MENCLDNINGNELFCPAVNRAPAWYPAVNELPIDTYLLKSALPFDPVGAAGLPLSGAFKVITSCLQEIITVAVKAIAIRDFILNVFIVVIVIISRIPQT